jgi:hypothetical protein
VVEVWVVWRGGVWGSVRSWVSWVGEAVWGCGEGCVCCGTRAVVVLVVVWREAQKGEGLLEE